MLVGYCRTSTIDQTAGLEAQERDLRSAGCEEIFTEQISAVATKRPELDRALAFLRTLLVARILGEAGEEAFGYYQPALELVNPLVALALFGAADVAESVACHCL